MSWKLPLFKIYWDEEDVSAVSNSIREGMFWAEGPNIKEFENNIARYIGSNYCSVFSSGTSALHSAIIAHNIGEGDEVIVPSFTFIATANAPLFVGAKPIFADIEEETLGLDPEDVLERISKKTKAIIPVHYGGSPCKIKELREIADDHDLLLIEDAAEAFGAEVVGGKIGTFGDSAMFSFCQNKLISTGEGGAIVTNSKKINEKIRLLRSHGRSEHNNYFLNSGAADYVAMGYNFRMSNITAALGTSQLKKVDFNIRMRNRVAEELNNKLGKINGIRLPIPPDGCSHVYQLYTIRVDSKIRDKLRRHLNKSGIMTKVYFDPVHLTHFYKNTLKCKIKLETTERISKEVLSLPMYPTLSEEEICFICEKIESYLSGALNE